jgi:uncharacterized protein (DUF3084 family)
MSEQKELEKLQAMRAELEAESRSLKEQQKNLEASLLALEEKAVIEELKKGNRDTKDAIAQLEAKKRELETRLKQAAQTPETPPPETEKKEAREPEPAEATPESSEEGGVTVTAIDDETLVEPQEANDKQQERKKHRFF